ncbi:MAG: acyl carrier protein [Bacteroidales bacterium]|jgi:acyl carrier protein|nr:acyl carrier protein [Bacteroidales bacterium]MBQ6741821.1 acyl carrier protein [Bacteroidales bacterium]
MEKQEIVEKLKKFFVEELEFDEEKMKPESLLKEDIGIDSLDFVDIAVFVEEEMGFRIKAEDKRNMKTFGDFCDYLAENIK